MFPPMLPSLPERAARALQEQKVSVISHSIRRPMRIAENCAVFIRLLIKFLQQNTFTAFQNKVRPLGGICWDVYHKGRGVHLLIDASNGDDGIQGRGVRSD
jgi:hypothetical protein